MSAAKHGFGIFVGARRGTFDEVLPNLRIYRDAWKAAGHPGEGEVYLRAPVYVGDTIDQALSDPEESLMTFYRYLGARLEESANRPGIFDTERRVEGAQRLQTLTWDEARRGRAIVGTSEIVADNLASLRDQLGLAGILAELNTGGLIRTNGSCALCNCCARRCSRDCIDKGDSNKSIPGAAAERAGRGAAAGLGRCRGGTARLGAAAGACPTEEPRSRRPRPPARRACTVRHGSIAPADRNRHPGDGALSS